MSQKGKKRGNYPPRPHSWLSGPDEFRHSLYIPWLKAKAQAQFRKEEWTLTFDEFFDLWKDDWHNRGRAGDNVCMTRIDFDGAWSKENTTIMSRKEHLILQGQMRKGTMEYKPRGPDKKPRKAKIKLSSSLGEQFYGKRGFYK